METNTFFYSVDEFDNALIETVLNEVYQSLKEKGYNPVNQLAGYLMSGDPGYISSYKDARSKIVSIDRSKILEYLLNKTIGDKS